MALISCRSAVMIFTMLKGASFSFQGSPQGFIHSTAQREHHFQVGDAGRKAGRGRSLAGCLQALRWISVGHPHPERSSLHTARVHGLALVSRGEAAARRRISSCSVPCASGISPHCEECRVRDPSYWRVLFQCHCPVPTLLHLHVRNTSYPKPQCQTSLSSIHFQIPIPKAISKSCIN